MAHCRDAWPTTRAGAAPAPCLTALPGTRDRRAITSTSSVTPGSSSSPSLRPIAWPPTGRTFGSPSMSSLTPTESSTNCSVHNVARTARSGRRARSGCISGSSAPVDGSIGPPRTSTNSAPTPSSAATAPFGTSRSLPHQMPGHRSANLSTRSTDDPMRDRDTSLTR